ncbi:MAG: NAD(P)-dependent oxidoreductase [Bacilli bacterium]|jgi:nucleoside-diphosphate-sugar epimerase|nr:NAD(P)-dependent oxidoreductase [Bacilli bacterium]
MIERVFIAGGTGFLGYHASLLFQERGIGVDSAALPNEINTGNWNHPNCTLSFLDLFKSSDQEIYTLFTKSKYDVFIYALGPDDRQVPNRPAYAFFHQYLVEQAKRICLQAKKAKIPKCIVLSSYFVHFADAKLQKHHPYIKARVEQISSLNQLADDAFQISYLLLPYIFGTMPGREPLWKKHFLAHFSKMPIVLFPKGGGTMAVDVSGVAQAIVGASLYGENKALYPVGKENIPFKALIPQMLYALGEKKRYWELPGLLIALGMIPKMIIDFLHKKQNGLHPWHIMFEVLNKSFYMDYKTTKTLLHYEELGFDGGKDVDTSIAETMKWIKENTV